MINFVMRIINVLCITKRTCWLR